MIILGISAYYHDAAAAIIQDGRIIAAAQEERFTRKKHDPSFPSNAVRFCLTHAGFSLKEVDAVVFYDKPWLKFERLLETYYAYAPSGITSFMLSMPAWIKEKLLLKDVLLKELEKIEQETEKQVHQPLNLLFSEHHLSHAASAYYPSPFKEAAILTIDGVGEWATASICHGSGKDLRLLKELRFPHSAGLLYSAFTYYLGFRVNSGEYKLMGLSPYGDPDSERYQNYCNLITGTLIDVKEDGSVFLNQDYFNYATGLSMVKDDRWEKLFGFARRLPESPLEQHHCDLALAIQKVTEDIVIKMATTAQKLTGSDNLCLAGGVALNCVANARILQQGIFKNVWIQPAAGDAGGALGAALAAYHLSFGLNRPDTGAGDSMQGSYLGPEFSELDVTLTARKYKAPCTVYSDFDSLCSAVAGYIARGSVIGWFQGRMEWGPRSLGNRSILGDARNEEMQKRMNLKIKYRESFRPFAPSVLAEDAGEYFDTAVPSPYMLLVADVHQKRRKPLPENYRSLSVKEKLYHLRSDIPAITHLDYSARLQTVHKETNPKYWQLIEAFKQQTGYGVIVNTSFNVRGEPIVCTPEDAYRCFMRTEIDYLVVGNRVFSKKEQPEWKDKTNWKEEFVLD